MGRFSDFLNTSYHFLCVSYIIFSHSYDQSFCSNYDDYADFSETDESHVDSDSDDESWGHFV